MKLEDTGQEYLDLRFEIPQPGVSLFQFEEGITKRTNETTGKTTLQLPLSIIRVIEGPEDNEGKKLSHFVPIESDFGERQLAGILSLTGLVDSFAQKFGGELDATSDKLINALKLKLPGKFIKGVHEVKKDQQGNDRANLVRLEKATKGSPPSKPKQKKPEEAADADW